MHTSKQFMSGARFSTSDIARHSLRVAKCPVCSTWPSPSQKFLLRLTVQLFIPTRGPQVLNGE
jgi:hypothetical protein